MFLVGPGRIPEIELRIAFNSFNNKIQGSFPDAFATHEGIENYS